MARVYISSTYEDLKEYRDAACQALRRLEYVAVAMEDYVATDQRPLAKCLKDVAKVDAYVGIFALRYGYIPEGEGNPDNQSITELEYRKALELKKSCFIFLLEEGNFPWQPNFLDRYTGDNKSGESIEKLRQELKDNHIVSFFSTPENLASSLSAAIAKWVVESNVNPEEPSTERQTPIYDRQGELVCPYQGLLAFTENERPFFFGRQAIADAIAKKLTQGRKFIPLIGSSGSGKSSVVLAGLIPRLKEVGWQVLEPIKPGYKPLSTLEEMLRKEYFSDQPELLDCCIHDGPTSQSWQPLIAGFSQKPHLLVVDQFEELFTVAQLAQRDRFIELITQVAEIPNTPLAITVTMRADFIEPCLRYDALRQLIQKNAEYLSILVGKNLIDAICDPARRQGYDVTDELLEQIQKDIKQEPGFLPLLEFALTQLWQKRDGDRHQLTLGAYEAIGGIVGALNCHADKVYRYRDYARDFPQNERTEAEKSSIKQIFLNLLQMGEAEKDTRLRQSKADLLSLAKENTEERETLRKLIEDQRGLVDGRLLVTGDNERGADAWVDLAHEALIEGWEQLNKWRNENREGRKFAKQAKKDAEVWLACIIHEHFQGV